MIKQLMDIVEGVQTTLPFRKFVCEHEAFRSGNFDTHFEKNIIVHMLKALAPRS
jgi:acetyl/propionyl-CoA carboxylase alpha subunit